MKEETLYSIKTILITICTYLWIAIKWIIKVVFWILVCIVGVLGYLIKDR